MDGRHRRRRTAGRAGKASIAAMLPALFLAALYVAAPFAGTTTHAIAYRTAASSPSAPAAAPGATVHPAQLIGSPVHLSSPGGAMHTMVVWYVGIVALAIAVVIGTAAGAMYRAWLRH
jgi:hypothetical protein